MQGSGELRVVLLFNYIQGCRAAPKNMMLRVLSLVAALHAGAALRLSPALKQHCKKALVAGFCSAQLLASPVFAAPTLTEAIVETSASAYPILKALPSDTFPAFSAKIGDLFLGFKPDKLAKSINLGVDLFNSVPQDDLTAFNAVVKESFAGLSADSCELVPLPPPSLVQKFTSSEGFAAADADKLKAFDSKWGGTLRALPRSQDGAKICLPPTEKLDKLALAQAKLGKAFGADEAKAFGVYFGGVSKASIVPGKATILVGSSSRAR